MSDKQQNPPPRVSHAREEQEKAEAEAKRNEPPLEGAAHQQDMATSTTHDPSKEPVPGKVRMPATRLENASGTEHR